jgi:lysophospholipase L1-like esterase
MTRRFLRTPRVRPLFLALFALLTLLSLALPLTTALPVGAADSCPADKRHLVPWQGSHSFLVGANVPWQNGGFGADFATVEPWGQHTYSSAATEAMFAELRASGANSVRWWLFADGRGAPEVANGLVTGFDATTLPKMADAIRLAEQHDISLTFTLWSFDMLFPADGPTGGRRELITDAAARRSFIDNALVPMLRHPVPGTSYTIGTHPNVISWEVINEPEWGVRESGSVHGSIREPVSLAEMQRFIAETAGAIHRNSNQLVTVGSAAMKWNSDAIPGAAGNWYSDAALQQYDPEGALDYYQIHFYPWMNGDSSWSYSPLQVSWQQGGFDKPVVVGEFPANAGGTGLSVHALLEQLFGNCYAGAWSWAYERVDSNGGWADTAPGMAQFTAAHPDEVAIGGNPAPPSPALTVVPPSPTTAPPSPTAALPGGTTTVLYNDRIAAGWQDWSWGVKTNPQASVAGQLGSASLGVSYTSRGGGLKLHRDAPLALSPTTRLQFRVHGGSGGAKLRIELRDGERVSSAPSALQPAAGRWSLVDLPVAQFSALPTRVTDLVVRDDNGALLSLAFDQIHLVEAPGDTPAPPPTREPAAVVVPVYDDALAPGVREDGWGVQTDLATTAERFSGTHALSARFTTGWGAVRLSAAAPFPRAGLQTLRLALHGGSSGGQRLRVILRPSSGAEQRLTTITLAAGKWQLLELPLPSTASLPDITSLVLQEDTGRVPGTFFIDAVELLGGASAGAPPPTSAPGSTPAPSATTAPPAPSPTRAPAGGELRLLPLGDSLTEGVNGGYRNRLWERLVADGRKVNYVGPRFDQWTRVPDKDHAGTPGFTVGNVLEQIDGYLARYTPDVVLLMIGTNDLAWWHVEGPAATAARLGTLLDRIRATAPQVDVVVASIPTMKGVAPPNNLSRATLVEQYNAAVENEVRQRAGAGMRVSFADVHAVVSPSDLYDDVHPNEAAHNRIADVWYEALTMRLR